MGKVLKFEAGGTAASGAEMPAAANDNLKQESGPKAVETVTESRESNIKPPDFVAILKSTETGFDRAKERVGTFVSNMGKAAGRLWERAKSFGRGAKEAVSDVVWASAAKYQEVMDRGNERYEALKARAEQAREKFNERGRNAFQLLERGVLRVSEANVRVDRIYVDKNLDRLQYEKKQLDHAEAWLTKRMENIKASEERLKAQEEALKRQESVLDSSPLEGRDKLAIRRSILTVRKRLNAQREVLAEDRSRTLREGADFYEKRRELVGRIQENNRRREALTQRIRSLRQLRERLRAAKRPAEAVPATSEPSATAPQVAETAPAAVAETAAVAPQAPEAAPVAEVKGTERGVDRKAAELKMGESRARVIADVYAARTAFRGSGPREQSPYAALYGALDGGTVLAGDRELLAATGTEESEMQKRQAAEGRRTQLMESLRQQGLGEGEADKVYNAAVSNAEYKQSISAVGEAMMSERRQQLESSGSTEIESEMAIHEAGPVFIETSLRESQRFETATSLYENLQSGGSSSAEAAPAAPPAPEIASTTPEALAA